jgi:hypothetical protein
MSYIKWQGIREREREEHIVFFFHFVPIYVKNNEIAIKQL